MALRVLDFAVAAGIVAALALGAWWGRDPIERSDGAVRIVDGDTLVQSGRRIRLRGMDAPELDQTCRTADGAEYRCGEVARLALQRLATTGPVTCEITGTDRYGRGLGRCLAGGVDLGRDLVRRGLATSYGGYAAEERDARAARIGLWAGSFDPPSLWRKAHPRDVPRDGRGVADLF